MTVDELRDLLRSWAFDASIETKFRLNEAIALVDILTAKAKSYDVLIKPYPDSWNWSQ
jgi:hypothetical protein